MKKKILIAAAMLAIIIPLAFSLFESGKKVDIPYCNGYYINDIPATDLKPCAKYFETFDSTIPDDSGIDPLLMVSLAYQESACNPNIPGGIMQDRNCLNPGACPDVQSQIAAGVNHFISDFNALYSKEMTGEQALKLSLFAYNRGLQTAKNALQKMDRGMPIDDAMKEACYGVFKEEGKGCLYCRLDSKGNDKCTHPGYGAKYPERILGIYGGACGKLGGTIQSESVLVDKLTEGVKYLPGRESLGSYSVRPTFEIRSNKELMSSFNELKSKADTLKSACASSENLEKCVNENRAILESADMKLSDCETQDEKTVHRVMEAYMLCKNSPEENCYCDVNLNMPPEEESSVTIENYKSESESGENIQSIIFSAEDASESVDGIFSIYNLDSSEYKPIESMTYSFNRGTLFKSSGIKFSNSAEWEDQKNHLIFVKSGNDIGIVEKNEWEKTPNKPVQCAAKKSTYTFCLVDESDSYFSKGPEKSPLQYKFAIDFSGES
ncbi:hypothetical protein HY638_00210 [Candidatus Woesearchaeota archaeon]|nr:hypothetical protein [Candidatus Woesearchaeota archaeon]